MPIVRHRRRTPDPPAALPRAASLTPVKVAVALQLRVWAD
jgi:hypothetical protein